MDGAGTYCSPLFWIWSWVHLPVPDTTSVITPEGWSLTWWFVSVNILLVSAQVIHSAERFVADIAGVGLHSIVVPHVKLHCVPAAVSVGTFWANIPPVERPTSWKLFITGVLQWWNKYSLLTLCNTKTHKGSSILGQKRRRDKDKKKFAFVFAQYKWTLNDIISRGANADTHPSQNFFLSIHLIDLFYCSKPRSLTSQKNTKKTPKTVTFNSYMSHSCIFSCSFSSSGEFIIIPHNLQVFGFSRFSTTIAIKKRLASRVCSLEFLLLLLSKVGYAVKLHAICTLP